MRLVLLLLSLVALLCLCTAQLPQKVNKCGTDDVVTVRETEIDGYVDALMGLHWLTNTVVYARSVVRQSDNSAPSILYRSDDGGKTWTNELSKFKNGAKGLYDIYPTAADGHAWVIGLAEFLWVTSDAGASYSIVNIPEGQDYVEDIFTHPLLPDYALIITEGKDKNSNIYHSLYATTDFGQSWKLVDKYVSVATWAVSGLTGGVWVFNHTVIWVALPESQRSSTDHSGRDYAVYHSEDWGATKHLIREHTPAMLVSDDAFFIAGWTDDRTDPLTLYVSTDGGAKFKACVFPHEETLSELNYVVLDATYDSSFVFVLHSSKNEWGNLYMSDSLDTNYELSLPWVVAYQNLGFGPWYPEFTQISRLPGLLLANVWDTGAPGPDSNTPIVSRASRNNGGTWGPLAAPQGSSCGSAKYCYLQLRGPKTSTYGGFYTDADAIGLVAANGNVGTALDTATPNPGTFFSRDAALTWAQLDDIGLGMKTFEFADHGAIFLSATTGMLSNAVYYSILEGVNFIACNYTGDDYKVRRTLLDIYNDPKMETAAFVAVGNKPGQVAVIEHFDFRSVFRRDCQGFETPDTPDSDYELWSPSYSTQTTLNCVLGENVQYVRRKQSSQCFNGEGYEIATNKSACPCTIEDFRCRECYTSVTNTSGTFCVLSCAKAPALADPPEDCTGTYIKSQEWEKIPLDQCIGAPPAIVGTLERCPGATTAHTILVVILVLVFLIFASVGGCWALAHYVPSVREFWSRTVPGIIAPTFGRSGGSSATYSLLKKPDSMDDDEEALAEGSQAKELDDDTILNYSKDGKESKDSKKKDDKAELL